MKEIFISLPGASKNAYVFNHIFIALENAVINKRDCNPELKITQQGNGPDDIVDTYKGFKEVIRLLDCYIENGMETLPGCNAIMFELKY